MFELPHSLSLILIKCFTHKTKTRPCFDAKMTGLMNWVLLFFAYFKSNLTSKILLVLFESKLKLMEKKIFETIAVLI